MSNAVLIVVLILGIVAIDASAVMYGAHVGMKYPYIAAAAVNMAIVIATHIAGIVWMILRRN